MKDILTDEDYNSIQQSCNTISEILLEYRDWDSQIEAIDADNALSILDEFIKKINSNSWNKEIRSTMDVWILN